MTPSLLVQGVQYISSAKNRTGTIVTNIQIPRSAIIISCRTVCMNNLVVGTGTPVINVGTSITPNLFLNALQASSIATAGAGTTVDSQTKIMDDTGSVIITISAGTIISGSFITYIVYYSPAQFLPNIPYVPPTPPSAGILQASLLITPDLIQNSNSSPVLIVPAPGTGRFNQILQASFFINYQTTPYTSTEILLAENPAAGIGFSYFSSGTGWLDALATPGNRPVRAPLVQNSPTVKGQISIDSPIFFMADSDSLVGDSPVTIYISYCIFDQNE